MPDLTVLEFQTLVFPIILVFFVICFLNHYQRVKNAVRYCPVVPLKDVFSTVPHGAVIMHALLHLVAAFVCMGIYSLVIKSMWIRLFFVPSPVGRLFIALTICIGFLMIILSLFLVVLSVATTQRLVHFRLKG